MIRKTRYGPDAMTDALHLCAGSVQRTAHAAWQFALRNGKSLSVEARLDGAWLRLTNPLQLTELPDPLWRLLTVNAELPAGARVAIPPRGARAILVDVFVENEASAPDRAHSACATLMQAASIVAGTHESTGDRCADPPSDGDRISAGARVCELISEAGWPNKPLADGTIEVPLEARGGPYQTLVEPHGDGLRARVAVASGTMGRDSREAVGALLLVASAALTSVRAAAESEGSVGRIRFEALLPPAPTAAEWDRTLGSLASACEHFGAEARALSAESLAREYLRVKPILHGG